MHPQDPRGTSGSHNHSRPSSNPPPHRGNQPAANIVRGQIDRIYGESNHARPEENLKQNNPYTRTHKQDALQQTEHSDALKQYHSAWQNYYQQYYERFYMQQLQANQQAQPVRHREGTKDGKSNADDIKDELLGKVKHRAAHLQRSTHFMPIISAIVVGLLFMGIQYNRLFVAQVKAYVSPGSTSSQNIIVDPTTSTKVSNEPRLIIPKINVDAPIVYNVGSLQESAIQNALRSGIVHYPIPGANSLPGQAGNAVFLGHSSNDVFDTGQYKFVFVLLERLQPGDTFYVNYEGVRYTYSITAKEVIDPTEVNKLVKPSDKPLATLVTCVPPGTALKRLVVYAEQINPDPAKATSAPADQQEDQDLDLPGNAPTLFERLFGGN